MWIVTVKNMVTGETRTAECKFRDTAFGTADVLSKHAIVPYRCYIKYVGNLN